MLKLLNESINPYRLFALKLNWVSNHILQESKLVYQQLQIPVEPNWIALLSILTAKEQLSVTEISEAIGIQHPSAIKIVRKLEASGFLQSIPNPLDSRSRLLKLTDKGRYLYKEANPIWEASEEIIAELTAAEDMAFMDSVDTLIASLKRTSFSYRVLDACEKKFNLPLELSF